MVFFIENWCSTMRRSAGVVRIVSRIRTSSACRAGSCSRRRASASPAAVSIAVPEGSTNTADSIV
ncbi:hypothetical protein [Sanguibacter sp. Z1732]|uniref:hypothetical protein n=1 Tax=Sanguibacter sp. Z1732 TaxID=3435412 RepID=UPI003D9C90E2